MTHPRCILNFHGVGKPPRDLDPGEAAVWLDTERFRSILDCVQGRRDVEITFDDGNRSDYTEALPELRQRNLRATFFICAGRLESDCFLSRQQVRELLEHGMRVGSHGWSHVSWRDLNHIEASREWAEAMKVLGETCGQAIVCAACPFGSYDRAVIASARAHGVRALYTSDRYGAMVGAFLQARYTIGSTDSPATVQKILSGSSSVASNAIGFTRSLLKSFR